MNVCPSLSYPRLFGHTSPFFVSREVVFLIKKCYSGWRAPPTRFCTSKTWFGLLAARPDLCLYSCVSSETKQINSTSTKTPSLQCKPGSYLSPWNVASSFSRTGTQIRGEPLRTSTGFCSTLLLYISNSTTVSGATSPHDLTTYPLQNPFWSSIRIRAAEDPPGSRRLATTCFLESSSWIPSKERSEILAGFPSTLSWKYRLLWHIQLHGWSSKCT